VSGYDYGRAGLVGIGTPQANPTVEAEMAILLPAGMAMAVTRLTSVVGAAPLERLRDYLLHLPLHLAAYDTLRPAVFGFACTASSYLVNDGAARAVLDACETRFGYPVVTAADAIAQALDRIGAQRIALVSPYPAPLREAAVRFWSAKGYRLNPVLAAGDLMPDADTRGIYALGSTHAAAALAQADLSGVDAVLLSGTGMPSLPLIAGWTGAMPVLSSNLCLAAALAAPLGQGDLLDLESAAGRAWRARCRTATLEA
jgi:maleate isomerase